MYIQIFTITVISSICIIGLIFIIFNGIEKIWRYKEYRYYSDENNFIEVTSEINHVVWAHSEKRLNLAFEQLPDIFSDENFYMEDDNYTIVIDNGGEEYLKLGDTITFVTAPRYFGDGYTKPIVAIKTEEKHYYFRMHRRRAMKYWQEERWKKEKKQNIPNLYLYTWIRGSAWFAFSLNSFFYLCGTLKNLLFYLIELVMIIYFAIKIHRDNRIIDNSKVVRWRKQKQQEKYGNLSVVCDEVANLWLFGNNKFFLNFCPELPTYEL